MRYKDMKIFHETLKRLVHCSNCKKDYEMILIKEKDRFSGVVNIYSPEMDSKKCCNDPRRVFLEEPFDLDKYNLINQERTYRTELICKCGHHEYKEGKVDYIQCPKCTSLLKGKIISTIIR